MSARIRALDNARIAKVLRETAGHVRQRIAFERSNLERLRGNPGFPFSEAFENAIAAGEETAEVLEEGARRLDLAHMLRGGKP